MKRHSIHFSRRAFSLLELLIVIAIIGILAALLTPSLAKARTMARGTYCLANEKAIGQALYLYANENNNLCVPQMITRGDSNGWIGPPGYPLESDGFTQDAFWSDQILLGQYAANTNSDNAHPLYMNGAASKHSPFICPADGSHDENDPAVGNLSYAMGPNFPSVLPPGTPSAAPPYSNMWNLSSVEKPSMEMVAVDGLGPRFSPGSYAEPYPFYGSTEPLLNFSWNETDPNSIYGWAKRHNGGANVVFIDGHAEFFADLKTGYDEGQICCHRVQ